MEFYSVEGWMKEWLANKTGGASENTMLRYRQVVRDFLASLGSRAKASLAGVSPGDIVSFRDKLRSEGRAVSTCNMVVKKILSVPFEAARKMGYIPTNPVAAVDLLGEDLARDSFGHLLDLRDRVLSCFSVCKHLVHVLKKGG